MWWVYVPTWMLGVGALVVAELGRRRAVKSDERAISAEQAARDAGGNAASLEVSLELIAKSMDKLTRSRPPITGDVETRGGSLWHSREGRPPGETDRDRATAAAAAARRAAMEGGDVAFNVEFVNGNAYRLRNVGTRTATHVHLEAPSGLAPNLPADFELRPLASSAQFVIVGALGSPMPGELFVSCAELDEPAIAPMPARP